MVPADSDRISRVPPYSGPDALNKLLPVRGFHPLRPTFPGSSRSFSFNLSSVLQPRTCRNTPGLGYYLFARHYSGNRFFFLLLDLLRCFSSAGLLQPRGRCCALAQRVVPFGYLRIYSYLPIPAAYRSLSRPSSPPGALGIHRVPFLTSFLFFFPTDINFFVNLSPILNHVNELIVENKGVEPLTPCLQSRCSSQLS